MKETIMVNIWGAQKPATLTTWKEIKKLGFRPGDRAFGTLNDGRQALFFMGELAERNGKTPENMRGKWWVTTETLEEIYKQEGAK